MINLAAGPAGALVCLVVALYVIVRGQLVVPGYVEKASREQIKQLNEEALKQDDLLRAQAEQLSNQRVANAKLESQASHLSEQVERLTAEIEGLRAQLGYR